MIENISVELKVKNPRVGAELTKVIAPLAGFRLDKAYPAKSCDLLILEIGDNLKEEFKLIHSLQSSGAAGAIFLTSSRLEPAMLLEALRAGTKEFFAQPIQGEEVRQALLKFQARWTRNPGSNATRTKGELIHLVGSKGGVGVTTLAVNLAAGLASQDRSRSVALVDMNLAFSELPIFLNVKTSFDWGDVARNISRVDATLLKSSLCKHPSGISLLTSPTGLDGVNPVTPDIIERLLEVMQETFEYTIIDGGQSLEDLSLKILGKADMVMLVANLNLPCLNNIKRVLRTFEALGYPQKESIKIIINRYEKNPVISLEEAAQSISHPLFWLIPNDFQTTMTAINEGKIISEVGKGKEICKSYQELALSVLGGGIPGKEKVGFWNKIAKFEKKPSAKENLFLNKGFVILEGEKGRY